MPFVHDESIQTPECDQINLDSGRVYRVKTGPDKGMVFPSVTRMLKAKSQAGLEKWRKRVGAAEANKISARATLQGTALHSLCERYIANLDLPPIQPNVQVLWNHVRPWLALNITRVYKQEADLYSKKLGVAGRTDLLADVGTDLCVVDFKSANQEKKKEWIEDYFIQGTFYVAALFEMTGFKAKRIVLPIIHPDGLQLEEAKPMQYFDLLMDRVKLFYATFDLEADTAVASKTIVKEAAACRICAIGDAEDEDSGLCKHCKACETKTDAPFKRPKTFNKILDTDAPAVV